MAMTLRQRLLKRFYPLFIWLSRKGKKEGSVHNTQGVRPPVSFYSLSATLNNGKQLSFESLKGRKVLVVNTASDCGYTRQYEELQKLYQHAKEELEIIAFPANDFKEQEKESDEQIATFCSVNYGVRFPIAKKTVVVKKNGQHPVYQWLTQQDQNGWNSKAPGWNFAKFLVNEEGVLTHYFEPFVLPAGTEIAKALQR